MARRRLMLGVFVGVLMAMWLGGAAPAFAAYQHAGETTDPANFLAVHPEAAGTKLDSCALCHSGGSYTSSGKTTTLGSCMWCHYIAGYNAANVGTNTLNPYGMDYLNHGRTASAIATIDGTDSDGDGYKNVDEIAALTYPGDATDNPAAITAAARVFTLSQLEAMPQYSEFLLMNGSKSTDFYTTYTGVTMESLLDAAGMLDSATQINVVSPDGFSQYFPLDPGTSTVAGMYPVRYRYPDEFYYYNSQADTATNPSGGWCNYSSPGCAGLVAGSPINTTDGEKMLVAWARDGARLDTGTLDVTNKLNGEGPFRVVPPQLINGAPDIGSNVTTTAAIVWPYSSKNDHNSGFSPRTATMIKVGPMPAGTTDINTLEAGWPYVDSDSIVVYGDIDPVPTVLANAHALAAYVLSLPAGDWAKSGEATALAGQINAFDGQLSADGIEGVISKVESNLLLKSDGVVLRGAPDRDDWVTDVTAQRKVYWGLRGIVTLLRSDDPVATSITIGANRSAVTRGAFVTLSGVLRPGSVGDPVRCDVKRPGSGRWSYLATPVAGSTSGAAGAVWSYRTALTARGSYSFRADFDATAYRLGSVSRTISVTVR